MADIDLQGAVLEDRYQVVEVLAEGAMGSVWRGERLKLGRQVAIKIMHEQLPDELASRERFEREAKLMARLDHPNCVSVIDFGIHQSMPFLVMELVKGTSLQQLMERDRRFEPARAVEIMRQVLSGLAHAHELGIVHRDIKPANLMVGERTGIGLQVRILDFGLARLTDTSAKLTTGIVVGTPNYMAPEQCKGSQVDGRCDLYACGVILFEMLTGRKPFVSDDPYQVVRKHLNEAPPRLGDVAPGDFGPFEAIVAKALAKSPDDRFANAQEMSRALEAAVRPLPNPVPNVARAPSHQQATESGWSVPPALKDTAVDSGLGPRASGLGSEPEPTGFVTDSMILPSGPTPAASDLAEVRGPKSEALPDRTEPVRAPKSALPFKLPLSPKQLAIGGGGLLALVVVIAVIASRGGSATTAKPSDKPVATQAQPNDQVAQIVAEIDQDLANDDREQALRTALAARKEYPDDARLAFAAGRAYFAKLYWTDGIKQFRDAIRLDPSYASNDELIKTALKGFNTTPYVDDRLEEFLRVDLGAAARPYLEETAQGHPNATVRARAKAELRRLPQ